MTLLTWSSKSNREAFVRILLFEVVCREFGSLTARKSAFASCRKALLW